jgi:hypothetical protein
MAQDYSSIIEAAGKKYNVDPALIRAVIGTETGGQANPNTATSSTGAVGVAQLMPATAKALGVTDRTDPTQNINGAAKLLDQLLTQTNGNVSQALTMYHGGQNPQNWGPQTQAYPGKVLSRLPGVPESHQQPTPGGQSDDDIFAAFGGGSAGGQTPQKAPAQLSDDDIFKSFSAPATAQQPATVAPAKQSAETQPAQGGDQYALGTGGVSNFIDALGHNAGNAVLGAAQTGLHGLAGLESGLQRLVGGSTPVNQASDALDQFIQNREQNYQQNVPTNLASIAGAGAGQVLPFLAIGGAGVISKGGQLADSVATMLGAGNKTRAVANAAGQAGGSSLLGLLAAGAQPVSDDGNFAQEKADQALAGAAVGAAVPGATKLIGGAAQSVGNTIGSLVRPFTESGQQRIAANVLRDAAGNAPVAATAQNVPGVQPTLAEATGNPGIAALQRALASRPGNDALSLRQTANQEARNAYTGATVGETAFDPSRVRQMVSQASNVPDSFKSSLNSPVMAQVLGDAEKNALNATGTSPFASLRQQAQDQANTRLASIVGTPGDVAAARTAANDAVRDNYNLANSRALPVDWELNSILRRPAMQQAMGRAQTLAREQDAGAAPIVYSQVNLNSPGLAQDTVNGNSLHYLKMALDDMASGKGPQGIAANEKRSILGTQNDLLNWFEARAPEYGEARQAYAQAMQPVNQLEYLQNLNLTDAAGNVSPGKLDTAIKGIQKAQQQPGLSPAKSITPDVLDELRGIQQQASGAKNAASTNMDPDSAAWVVDALQSRMSSPAFSSMPQADRDALTRSYRAAVDWLGKPFQTSTADRTSAAAGQYLAQKNLTPANTGVRLSAIDGVLNDVGTGKITLPDAKVERLQNLRDSLMQQQNLNAGQNAVRGSTTAQNLATGSILDAQQPALVRMLLNGTGRSLTTGGLVGSALGSALGGPGGAAAGAAIGSQLGSTFGGALRSKAPEVEARVLQMLLNPEQGVSALAPKANRFPLATGKNLNAATTAIAGSESGKNSR